MEIHGMDWMYDNDFMTYNQLIERLRVDLDDPTFFAFDLAVPHSEEEYQNSLHDMRIIHDLLIKHKDIAPTINIDELG